jgi:prepilin-type N-terminal cleavage/methylation domain-containing protein
MILRSQQHGFTLVELSIVLVIIGLLTGGIMGGQALLKASKLRSVQLDYTRFTGAVIAFKDQYNGLPGDITNATTFWGAQHVTPATCRTTPSTGQATCDGDGNRTVNDYNGELSYSERHRFWQQMANAGFIEGQYSGVGYINVDPTYNNASIMPGYNSPKSKFGTGSTVGYGFFYNTASSTFLTYTRHTFGLGVGSGNGLPDGVIFKPEELWSIDTKVDDGKPGTGGVQSYTKTARANCATTDVASTAVYNLSYNDIGCNAVFVPGL